MPTNSSGHATTRERGALSLAFLAPEDTDRATFVGMTGSGKTTLAEYMLATRDYVVALDVKGLLNWPGYRVVTRFADAMRAEEPRIIYRPVYAELQSWDALDKFFEWIYQRHNTTLYVDEVYGVTQGPRFPYHLGACLTRGRERRVEVWAATQRPAFVPAIFFSEAEHMYCFRLQMPQDREKMYDVAGLDPDVLAELPKHHFLYARPDDDTIGPLKLNL